MSIHSTAIVDKGAKLGKNVEIGPYTIVQGGTEIGDDTKLWHNIFVASGTTIGKSCQIHMGAVLGHEPQDIAFKGGPSYLKIGDRNIIREFVTIHRGTQEGSTTAIGDDNFIMGLCHVGHNCKIGNKVTICNSSLLAGHVEVGDMVFMSGGCVIHQFVRIGKIAMVGGSARIGKDVPPFMTVERDSVVASYNVVGIRRAGLDVNARKEIKKAFSFIYRSELNIKNALIKMEEELVSAEAKFLIDFIRSSEKRGICSFGKRRADEI
ncbi:MAG: acyl-ACP--UDP-N-acetylglucosamine O-acyltransferase [Candidatus Omnitrophota bacterium]